MTLELRLLLACARVRPGPQDEAAIGQMLAEGIDWTLGLIGIGWKVFFPAHFRRTVPALPLL